jgi:hypothetical protein
VVSGLPSVSKSFAERRGAAMFTSTPAQGTPNARGGELCMMVAEAQSGTTAEGSGNTVFLFGARAHFSHFSHSLPFLPFPPSLLSFDLGKSHFGLQHLWFAWIGR